MNIWSIFDHLLACRCPLCRAHSPALCAACARALPHNAHACTRCALPLPTGAPVDALCVDCQRRAPPFDRVLAPLLYRSPVDDLIARFKYHDRLDLGRLLSGLLYESLQADREPRPQLLLPVPMDAQGLRRRGFNQAAELARQVAAMLDIHWSTTLLQRARHVSHQRGLGRRARQRNLRGGFHCSTPPPPHVAVIDDVVTTGATAAEIAVTLKRAGAERVDIWAVARTPATQQD